MLVQSSPYHAFFCCYSTTMKFPPSSFWTYTCGIWRHSTKAPSQTNLICQYLYFPLLKNNVLQVAVGDLDPKTGSFPLHVLDPFFCHPYNQLRFWSTRPRIDISRMLCYCSYMLIITTPSRPGQLAESAGHLAGFLQVRHLALTFSRFKFSSPSKWWSRSSGTAGFSSLPWSCCKKTAGAKYSQGWHICIKEAGMQNCPDIRISYWSTPEFCCLSLVMLMVMIQYNVSFSK